MNPANWNGGLVRDEAGLWVAATRPALSYPADGNERCFLVEDRSYWFRHRNACILAAMRRHPPAGPVLDVGGGNGYVTRGMIDAGFPAVLLEPGPAGAFNAKVRRGIPEVVCATLEEAGIPENSLDAAGLFDVLEHIEDDRGLLAALHARLKPGGLLYLTVPAQGALWSASDVRAGHFRRYRPAQLEALFDGAFDLRCLAGFFRALVVPILAFRAIPFRLGLARRGSVLPAAREHGVQGGGSVRLVERLLAGELRRIEAGTAGRWGASLLCVARKKG
jgi:SAM-dependent methyltransferase